MDWTVDVCAAVPQGYQIVGVYDIDGNLIASNDCIQTGVAGETKVIAFEVLDMQSPPPHLSAKLKIKHNGKNQNDQFEISGHRKGKDVVRCSRSTLGGSNNASDLPLRSRTTGALLPSGAQVACWPIQCQARMALPEGTKAV